MGVGFDPGGVGDLILVLEELRAWSRGSVESRFASITM